MELFISKKKFNSLDRMFSSFIWDGKQPRISKAFLQRPKTSGGISMPNLHHYYWACNIQKEFRIIAHIQSDPLEQAPDWVKMEAHGLHFHSLVTSPLPLAFRTLHTNPVVAHTLKIWSQFRKQFGLLKASLMAPL